VHKLFCLSILFLLMTSCITGIKEDKSTLLIGEWINSHNNEVKLIFKEDGFFEKQRKDVTSDGKFLEKDSTGMLIEVDYGPFQYKVKSINGDSISCDIVGSKNGKVFSKHVFIISDSKLFNLTYKTLPGIENHIDEIGVYYNAANPSADEENGIVEKIILPQGHSGSIHIAYGQKDGAPVELDEWGNRILEVSKNGLLKTKMQEDPMILAMDRFEFYQRDSITGKLSRLRDYQHGEFRTAAYQLKNNSETLMLKHDPDSTAVFVWGFNQSGRKRNINKAFKEIIEGNVLSVEIDTVKNRLRLDWYGNSIEN